MSGKHWGVGDGCRGRPLIQCRGKAIGGCSSLNLCNYIRGHPAEFDAWGAEVPGWSYRELLPYFQLAERLGGAPAPEDNAPFWAPLAALLAECGEGEAGPSDLGSAASAHPYAARREAAVKLVVNHLAVLRDMTNRAPSTQRHLKRLATEDCLHASDALREVAVRLICGQGTTSARGASEAKSTARGDAASLASLATRRPEPPSPAAAAAWAAACTYLAQRTQATDEASPGRKADMSAAAAAALCAVLEEVRREAATLVAAGPCTPKEPDGPPPPAPSVLAERLQSAHAISSAFVAGARQWLAARDNGRTFEPSHALEAPEEGSALHWVTVRDGMRCSNARLLYSATATAARAQGRLRVETGCRALKLVLESAESDGSAECAHPTSQRVVGLLVRDRHGTDIEIRARREVVLCAGAINTPHLLQLSGIGPAAELSRHGVTPLVDLPGVGQSLRDTAAVGISSATAHQTLDKQLLTPWPYVRYLLRRDGPLASNTLEASTWISAQRLAACRPEPLAQARSPSRSPRPSAAGSSPHAELSRDEGVISHVISSGGRRGTHGGGGGGGVVGGSPPAMQLLVQPMLFPFASWGKFAHFVAGLKKGNLPSALTIHIVLLRPRSTGQVMLRSPNPLMAPEISCRYLSDPRDLDDLVAGVRLSRELLQGAAAELQPAAEILPGDAVTSDDQLLAYVRANACHFNGSLCGSCRMGGDADRGAVVDERLRVRGVAGLRIADASVLPGLVSGQLNAVVTAVAEKAVALILEDYGSRAKGGTASVGSGRNKHE